MFCTHCGKEIKDDSVFCKFCGKQAAGGAPSAAPAPNNFGGQPVSVRH